MTKISQENLVTSSNLVKETVLDKTTRIMREITELEAEKRQTKMARLRAARLEREANTPAKAKVAVSVKTGKRTVTKAKTPL